MEFARGASSTTRVDDGYRLPDHPPPHAQMIMDVLRQELLKESIRQELIVAELAGQRELGPEVLGELRMGNAGPLCARGGLQLTTLPHCDTSPERQDDQLHNIPLLPKLRLEEALMTPGGALMLMWWPAIERIEEWYQPPWRDKSGEEDASIIWTRQSRKTFSGVKRKRTIESSAPNKKDHMSSGLVLFAM